MVQTIIGNEAQAKIKLEEAVQKHVAGAGAVVQRVLSTVLDDHVVKDRALGFKQSDEGGLVMLASSGQEWSLHPHALGQVAEIAQLPMPYVNKRIGGLVWERDLLASIFGTTFYNSADKHLIRSPQVEGSRRPQARGVLSDRYRRLDTRPLVETFVQGVQRHGGVPFSGTASDTRVSIKAIVPRVREVLPGEWVAMGIELSNSDYGAGTYALSAYLLRLTCINGATTEDMMRQVHLGGRLSESMEFSRRTYELDTQTFVSATRDVVDNLLSEKKQDETLAAIRLANEKEFDGKRLETRLAKVLTKDELRKVKEAFDGPDVVNLPPGNTAWRASNALSWVAHTIESADRKLEFERLAGGMLVDKPARKAA